MKIINWISIAFLTCFILDGSFGGVHVVFVVWFLLFLAYAIKSSLMIFVHPTPKLTKAQARIKNDPTERLTAAYKRKLNALKHLPLSKDVKDELREKYRDEYEDELEKLL